MYTSTIAKNMEFVLDVSGGDDGFDFKTFDQKCIVYLKPTHVILTQTKHYMNI